MANSRDLVRLLVNFDMVKFHPQLMRCPYTAALAAQSNPGMVNAAMDAQSQSSSKLARKVTQWQEQRLKNVQKIIDEYNDRGWNQQETLRQINHSIQDDVSDDRSGVLASNQVEQLKLDYKNEQISSKDIFLPPYLYGLTNEQIRQKRLEFITH